jgi:NAD+ synthase
MATQVLRSNVLDIDCAAEVEKINSALLNIVVKNLRRRGVVVALSGGVDSSVCAALAVKAFGKSRVFGLLLPEKESSKSSSTLGSMLAKQLDIEHKTENIASTLEAIGCYRWRDEAIKNVFPEYNDTWKNKIVINNGANGGINFFKLVVQSESGEIFEKRLPHKEYLQIVAATNFKQRIRKTIEYFYADKLNYAVIGTPNRLEYDQGFFVKNGDGSADIKPIAHLYKTQVYQLAKYLKLPDMICGAKPSTDTYSMEQGQDEFYFMLPYDKMDLALWAKNNKTPVKELAQILQVSEAHAELIYKDIDRKRSTTAYLHCKPHLIEPVNLGMLPK